MKPFTPPISLPLYSFLLVSSLASAFSMLQINEEIRSSEIPSPSTEMSLQHEVGATNSVPARKSEDAYSTSLFSEPPAAAPIVAIKPVITPLPAPIVVPPPAPQAPPIPFQYLGRMNDGERTLIFLRRGENSYATAIGDEIDGIYLLKSADASSIKLIYTPLNFEQRLTIR